MPATPNRRSIDVLVITRSWPTTDEPERGIFVQTEVEALRRLGLTVKVITAPHGSAAPAYLRMWRSMHRTLRAQPIGVVHAHYGLTGWVARAQWRAPVVVTFHGSDLLGSRGMVAGRPSWKGRLESMSSSLLARIVAVPVIVTERMRSSAPSKAQLIPAGIDTSVFVARDRESARQQLGIPPDERILLFVANPARGVKRYSLAAAAAQEIDRLGQPVTLKPIFGESSETVAEWMAAADALIMTSESEGSPVVIREALACGLPIVSVDVGDVVQRLHGVDHCFVASADPAALGRASLPVLRRRPRVDDARSRIWSADQAAAALAKVYARAAKRSIGQRGQPPAP